MGLPFLALYAYTFLLRAIVSLNSRALALG
jgi:hypothetical protein